MPQPWGGYIRHNVICRKVNDETGQPLKIERICENNALMMYEPLLPANENHKHADK
jgi:vancomycin resistance protein VanW